ncbi:TATA-binding related factor [Basidiobolus meristosporus CBS 931.73]|uniref:Mediator of RNA polymerase II transcription subunit 20 n=1 Tax=Basidiobolus meristosporus CBS 931.73 TaxID=1314790 RepID=A0A1Y1YBK9_9FUNG|nr:TATA-binding related factor [Basidiobolus meristosporus CBS 931.73]|eukprot:ORX95332.1 TATA-binding related factor [Basidiobolus meristosporus CBS 931.73]
MGVTCVLRWTDANGAQSLNMLQERIVKVYHGKISGRWNLSCKVYRDTNPINKMGTGKLLYLVYHSSYPSSVFSMIDGVIVEADRELDFIVNKLKNIWVTRQNLQVEGYSFDIGDFVLRAGNIMVGSSYKGMMIEIEYKPCSIPTQCNDIFSEFLQNVIPPGAKYSLETDYKYESVGLSSETFSPTHTGYHYMNLFWRDNLL